MYSPISSSLAELWCKIKRRQQLHLVQACEIIKYLLFSLLCPIKSPNVCYFMLLVLLMNHFRTNRQLMLDIVFWDNHVWSNLISMLMERREAMTLIFFQTVMNVYKSISGEKLILIGFTFMLSKNPPCSDFSTPTF